MCVCESLTSVLALLQVQEQKRTLEAQVDAYQGVIRELKDSSASRSDRIEELEKALARRDDDRVSHAEHGTKSSKERHDGEVSH